MYMLICSTPQSVYNISYANWTTIIFPIADRGGRTCLFLMTLFVILSMSLGPSLQRCCQGDHLFIPVYPFALYRALSKTKPLQTSTLATLTNWKGHLFMHACALYLYTSTHIHMHVYQHTLSLNSQSKDINLWINNVIFPDIFAKSFVWKKILSSIHPSIICCLSWVRSRWQQVQQHLLVPPTGSWGIPRPDGIYNFSSIF